MSWIVRAGIKFLKKEKKKQKIETKLITFIVSSYMVNTSLEWQSS